MILLEFNKDDFDYRLRMIMSAKSNIQKAVDQLNGINSFKLDNHGLREILNGNAEGLFAKIERAIDDDLINSGTQSPTLRQLAKKGDLEAFYAILNKFPRPDYELSQYISINEEGFVQVSAKAETDLKEACSRYIKTERGLAIYQAQEKLIGAMNELVTLCPKLAGRGVYTAWQTKFDNEPFARNDLNYDGL